LDGKMAFPDIEPYERAQKISILELAGVLECWSIVRKDIEPAAITPSLQYSNTPSLIEIKIFQQELPYFEYDQLV
jgi:hypothetical protein